MILLVGINGSKDHEIENYFNFDSLDEQKMKRENFIKFFDILKSQIALIGYRKCE